MKHSTLLPVRATRPVILFALILCGALPAQSQDIMVDRNGDDVFLFYEANKTQFSLASGEPALSIAYTLPLNSWFYYIDNDGDQSYTKGDEKTVSKSFALSLEGKLKSTDDYLFLSDLGNMRPAFEFQVGLQSTIDKVNDSDALSKVTFAAAKGVMFKATMDNTRLYDSVNQTSKRYQPWSAEVKGHLTLVRSRWFLLSFSAAASYTWNKDDLLKYQKNDPTYVDPNAIALEDFVGFIGQAKRDWTSRLRMSIPFFIETDKKFLSRLSLAPYAAVDPFSDTRIGGFALSYFNDAITGKDYTYSEAFGLGIDWEKSGTGSFHPKLFIFGTLKIGELASWDDGEEDQLRKKKR